MKIRTSSPIVPRLPINHGRLVRKYLFVVEWNSICRCVSRFSIVDQVLDASYAATVRCISEERQYEEEK